MCVCLATFLVRESKQRNTKSNHQERIHRAGKKSCLMLKRKETAAPLLIPLPLFTLRWNSTMIRISTPATVLFPAPTWNKRSRSCLGKKFAGLIQNPPSISVHCALPATVDLVSAVAELHCNLVWIGNESMKIEHTAFNVEEPVLMARWYVEHLGMKVLRRTTGSPYAHFITDDSGTVMIEIYGNPDAPLPDYREMNPGQLHLAFVSSDIPGDTSRLLVAGATLVADVHQLGDDTFAMLRDPWGLPLQLVQRATPMV